MLAVTVAVVQFGGSNCDRDTVRALGLDPECVERPDRIPVAVAAAELNDGDGHAWRSSTLTS